jgi:hypothetical protein
VAQWSLVREVLDMLRRWGWRLAVVTIAVGLCACTQAAGMGWIPSSVAPTDKATFGFVLDATTSTLSGSYHDPNGKITSGMIVEVAFKGTGVMKPQPPPPDLGDFGCVIGYPSYDSQNLTLPGSGTFTLLVCDLDHFTKPKPTQDILFIVVDTGPFQGYKNFGVVQGGNITVT